LAIGKKNHIITAQHEFNITKQLKNTYFVITKPTPMLIPNAMKMQSTLSLQSQLKYKFTQQNLILKKIQKPTIYTNQMNYEINQLTN